MAKLVLKQSVKAHGPLVSPIEPVTKDRLLRTCWETIFLWSVAVRKPAFQDKFYCSYCLSTALCCCLFSSLLVVCKWCTASASAKIFWVPAHHRAHYKPDLTDHLVGHKTVTSQDRWSLVTASITLKCTRTFCLECAAFQDRWSVMAMVSWQVLL